MATAMSIAESLVEFRKQPDKSKAKSHKGKGATDVSHKPSDNPKSGKKKENTFKFKKPEYSSNKNVAQPPIKCFICEVLHL